MKTSQFLQLAIMSCTLTLHAESVTLFNAGVDNTGTKLPGGAIDPHWIIVSGPGIASPVPAVVLNNQTIFSRAQSPASSWVWANAAGVAGFDSPYTYRLTFDLTGLDPKTAVITGQWAVDNIGFIRLNGSTNNIGTGTLALLDSPLSNFELLHAFTLTNGFTPGTNILEFVVTDQGVGGGFNVTELTGTALFPPIALFNAGVDNTGTKLPGGATDPHWTIVSGPGIASPIPAVTLNNQWGFSYAQSTASSWVWANAAGVAGFNSPYTFQMTFDLTGLDPRTAVITGQWAGDNVGFIRLNGTTNNIGTGTLALLDSPLSNFELFHAFTLTNGFSPGTNILEFVVTDQGVGGGFNVTELVGTAHALPPAFLTIRISQMEICWQSATNFHYQLQYRSSLTTNQWIDLGSPISGDGTRQCFADAVVEGQPQRFFRIMTLP